MGRERWVTGGLLGTFAALRVFSSAGVPVRFPDTLTYLPLNFLGRDERFWTVPVVWNLADTDGLRVAVQVALGVVAWSMLALALGRLVANVRLRWIAMVVVLLLGLIPQVTEWDRALLSESLASSLLVLLIAVLLRISSGRSRGLVVCALAVTILWIFTRQLNALLFLCLLPPVLGFVLWRLRGRERLAVTAALVLIGGWSGIALSSSTPASREVEVWNSVQILENRIAIDPSALAFFHARGLPTSPYIAAERGDWGAAPSPLLSDPTFIRWINNQFPSAYASYLLRHWSSTLGEPFVRLPAAISFPVLYTTPREVLPIPIAQLLWDSDRATVLWALLAAACVGLAVRARARVRAVLLIALLILFSVVGAVLTWNLTGYGPRAYPDSLARLFMPVAISVRLVIVLAVALSLDALLCGETGELQRVAGAQILRRPRLARWSRARA